MTQHTIARVPMSGAGATEEAQANARLLAAAPDLLAALRDILADCEAAAERRTSADWDFAVTHAIEYASAAIAKVEVPE